MSHTHAHAQCICPRYKLHLSTFSFGNNVEHDSDMKGEANERDAQPATGMSVVKRQPQHRCAATVHKQMWSLSPFSVEVYQEIKCALACA